MYAKARRGEIKDFTAIDDPYEPPLQPEITLDTVAHLPEENAALILQELIHRGFVREPIAPALPYRECIGEDDGRLQSEDTYLHVLLPS
jgi:hypothetical protein